MAYAPVIAFDQAKRAAICRQLHHRYGITIERMAAVHDQDGDQGLHDLWTRERTIANLRRLNGCGREFYTRHTTEELVELERATLRHLMNADGRTPDQLIYSFGGRKSKDARTARRQHLAAWGIPA